jgi:hypothetical protein
MTWCLSTGVNLVREGCRFTPRTRIQFTALLCHFCVGSPIGARIDYQPIIQPVLADVLSGYFAVYLHRASVLTVSYWVLLVNNASGYRCMVWGPNSCSTVRKWQAFLCSPNLRDCQWTLSCISWIEAAPSQAITVESISLLYKYLCLL